MLPPLTVHDSVVPSATNWLMVVMLKPTLLKVNGAPGPVAVINSVRDLTASLALGKVLLTRFVGTVVTALVVAAITLMRSSRKVL